MFGWLEFSGCWSQMWILGNPIKIEGAEYANTRAIYICNHASPIDIFLMMWLTPTGTVGIAKKEVYIPKVLIIPKVSWLGNIQFSKT